MNAGKGGWAWIQTDTGNNAVRQWKQRLERYTCEPRNLVLQKTGQKLERPRIIQREHGPPDTLTLDFCPPEQRKYLSAVLSNLACFSSPRRPGH